MSFNVPVTNDTAKESTETFNVRLSSSSNAALGNPALTTVSIVDNKKPRGPRPSVLERGVKRKVDISQNSLMDQKRNVVMLVSVPRPPTFDKG